MAFMYDLEVPTTVHPSGELEVQMDLSGKVVANLYEIGAFDNGSSKPVYTLEQNTKTKEWTVTAGNPLSDEDLKQLSEDLTLNLDKWADSDVDF